MKQILVTGGTGNIGSHTAVELQNAGYEVVIVDNLSNFSLDVLDGIEKITGIRPVFEEFDLIESDKVDAFLSNIRTSRPLFILPLKAVGESVMVSSAFFTSSKGMKQLLIPVYS